MRKDLENFWLEKSKNLFWNKQPSLGFSGNFEFGDIRWFEDGSLNACENCLDIHLGTSNENTIAYYFEQEDGLKSQITYKELLQKVSAFCWYLMNFSNEKKLEKGDCVLILLPSGLECVVSLLACARLGLIHCVVFAGMSAKSIEMRLIDCNAKAIITMDHFLRGGKMISLLETIMEIPKEILPKIFVNWSNLSLDNFLQQSIYPATKMNAMDPLFILYTSGSTGKPKGIVHGHGGYLTQVKYTFKEVMDYNSKDIFFSTADFGWITGHSYGVYGPLMNAATSLCYSGAPLFPHQTRLWELIDFYKATHFYTAPTLLRMMMGLGEKANPIHNNFSLESLKWIGSVGEAINDEVASWYQQNVGKNKCHYVDTWWQTETGAIMLTPKAINGIQPKIIHENELVLSAPWPSMAITIWKDVERYQKTYFLAHPGFFSTYDQVKLVDNTIYKILGRLDDVINVSGHRLGTNELESAIMENPLVAAVACVGIPDPLKGESFACFIVPNRKDLAFPLEEINFSITKSIGKWAIGNSKNYLLVHQLPQTRSGKTMRRVLKGLFLRQSVEQLGDLSTMLNPECIQEIQEIMRTCYS